MEAIEVGEREESELIVGCNRNHRVGCCLGFCFACISMCRLFVLLCSHTHTNECRLIFILFSARRSLLIVYISRSCVFFFFFSRLSVFVFQFRFILSPNDCRCDCACVRNFKTITTISNHHQ